MLTIKHTRMGEAVHGVAPGEAEIWGTLRTRQDDRMARLRIAAEALTAQTAPEHSLKFSLEYHENFVASVNALAAV